jgi:PPOX class probable F420-dependent enzyme
MASMSKEAREALLSQPQVGILATLGEDGAPIAVPIWFEWDGKCARMFTSGMSPKVRRLQKDPRASLLVARPAGEPEEWVAVDGTVEIHEEGALQLAERLAERYWDLSDEGHKATLELWRKASQTLRLIELKPTRIRSQVG